MKEKYTQFAGVALALVALIVSGVALMQSDNVPAADQPQARGTTYFGNLSASGTMNADGATTLNSTLDVDGNVSSGTGSFTVTDSANITGAVDFDSTMNVDGASTLGGAVTVNNNATVTGTFAAGGATTLSGATTVNNNLIVTGTGRVDGAVNLNSTVDIDGNITSGTGGITLADTVNATGAVDFDSTLNVDGASTLNGAATVNNNLIVTGTGRVDGAVNLNSTVDIDGNITSGTGGITLADTVNATGAVDFDSTLNVDGASTLGGAVTVNNSATVTGAVTFQGAFYSSFTDLTVSDGDTLTPTYTTYALDSAGNVTITLAATGTEGQLLVLIGDDANDITINDTNVRTNDGAAQVLNQYDVIMWVYQDSEWIEISESNNS